MSDCHNASTDMINKKNTPIWHKTVNEIGGCSIGGVPVGIWYITNLYGIHTVEFSFYNGKIVSYTKRHDNGSNYIYCEVADNKLNGTFQVYYRPQSKIGVSPSIEGLFKNGNKIGKWTFYNLQEVLWYSVDFGTIEKPRSDTTYYNKYYKKEFYDSQQLILEFRLKEESLINFTMQEALKKQQMVIDSQLFNLQRVNKPLKKKLGIIDERPIMY